MKREAPRGGASLFLWQPPRREQGRISCIVQQQGDKLEVINIFANIPYLLTVHHSHKLGGHNCP